MRAQNSLVFYKCINVCDGRNETSYCLPLALSSPHGYTTMRATTDVVIGVPCFGWVLSVVRTNVHAMYTLRYPLPHGTQTYFHLALGL